MGWMVFLRRIATQRNPLIENNMEHRVWTACKTDPSYLRPSTRSNDVLLDDDGLSFGDGRHVRGLDRHPGDPPRRVLDAALGSRRTQSARRIRRMSPRPHASRTEQPQPERHRWYRSGTSR